MIRALVSLLAGITLVVALGACTLVEGDGRHLVPLSSAAKGKLAMMGSSPDAAMLIRIYKQEGTLEVWKQTNAGYKIFETYDICAWSGELGPKIAEGDRQAPEGFYTINPGLMNPRSNYHLAFNLGFPNKFDRAHGRTGSNLMVHGACSSAGCYAMEDEQISEIYALARESFKGGNRSFQVQIFPFRMTPENLAAHRDNPNFDFWMNLKQGADYFEVAQQPPAWDVCEGRYVFSDPSAANAAASMAAQCTPLRATPAVMSAYVAKQTADRQALEAELVAQRDSAADAQAAERREARREAEFDAREDAVGGFFDTLASPIAGVFGG